MARDLARPVRARAVIIQELLPALVRAFSGEWALRAPWEGRGSFYGNDVVSKIAAGHKLAGIHGRYISVPDAEMGRIFADKLGWKNVCAVSTQELRQIAASAN